MYRIRVILSLLIAINCCKSGQYFVSNDYKDYAKASLKNIFVSPYLTLLKREGSVGRQNIFFFPQRKKMNSKIWERYHNHLDLFYNVQNSV